MSSIIQQALRTMAAPVVQSTSDTLDLFVGPSYTAYTEGPILYSGTTNNNILAVATGLEIPKDGNWYYWEVQAITTQYASTSSGLAVHYNDGMTSWNTQSAVASSWFGQAYRWYASRWNRVAISSAGTYAALNAPHAGLNRAFPGVAANGAGRTIKLVARRSEQQFVPNIAAQNASAYYQAPTLALIND